MTTWDVMGSRREVAAGIGNCEAAQCTAPYVNLRLHRLHCFNYLHLSCLSKAAYASLC